MALNRTIIKSAYCTKILLFCPPDWLHSHGHARGLIGKLYMMYLMIHSGRTNFSFGNIVINGNAITSGSASPGSHYFWYAQPIYIYINFQQDGIQPGKIVPVGGGPIKINSGRRTVKQLNVTSLCDRPIQVSNIVIWVTVCLTINKENCQEPWV